MPTCVLSASLLDECWINFFLFFFKGILCGRLVGVSGLVLEEFCFLSDGGQREGADGSAPQHCCRQSGVGAGRSWQG